jgi:CRISPR-associated endonuclease Cas1
MATIEDNSFDGDGEAASAIDVDEFPDDIDAPVKPLGLRDFEDVVEATRTTYSPAVTESETVIADGFNIALTVRNGCLEISDGVHPYRRTRTISRTEAGPLAKVRRILVLGAGMVTTEAMAWCHRRNLPLVVARTGTIPTMVGGPALFDHAGLRRAQALAPYLPGAESASLAVTIAHWLTDLRLADQARIAESMLDDRDASEVITAWRRVVVGATDPADILLAEAKAADRYWASWHVIQLRFANRDQARVPPHWRGFGGRRSDLSANAWTNRHATDPINALLNLGAKVAETEATWGLLALGLDPAMGLGHALRGGRPSAALDLMEPARGTLEQIVLGLISERTFRKVDFTEDPKGLVRVNAPLSHELVRALAPVVRDRLAPLAEHMAEMLAAAQPEMVTVPTVLTGSNRGRPKTGRTIRFRPTCHSCGRILPEGRRTYCDECLPEARRDRGLSHVGVASRRRSRVARTYTSKKSERQAEEGRRRTAKEAAWEAKHRGMRRPDPAEFAPIAVGLQRFTASEIARHLGVSVSIASKYRRGLAVPHVRHWAALAELADVPLPGP